MNDISRVPSLGAPAPGDKCRHFDPEIIAYVDSIGVHPFIIVRSLDRKATTADVVSCRTQNETAEFIETLAAVPGFAQSRLVRAVVMALQSDAYEAGELFFSWAASPATVTESVLLGLPDGQCRPWFYGYPVFEIGVRRCECDSFEQRIITLAALFESYDSTAGNNRLRFSLIESLALGLCRALGSSGRFVDACRFVGRALAISKHSIHLKAAAHALQLRLEGGDVPARLVKFIGHDDGYLKRFICPHPFENFEVNHNADVLTCAGPWISSGIGNFLTDNIDDIMNSKTAREIRKSIVTGTYKFCNHMECSRMIQGNLPTRKEVEKTHIGDAIARPDHRVDAVRELVFAFDKTCNLSCPSCRTELIADTRSTVNEKLRAIEEKLPQLLPTLRTLEINASGELFASRSSRKVLELIEDGCYPDLKLDIISNGTLFSEKEWDKYPGIHDKIRSIRISTDAACKATFERLRRGGHYETFLENAIFLSGLRVKKYIPILKFSFTYQIENFREMREFVRFCTEMHGDFALFERLLNVVFSDQEYRRKAVHLAGHPQREEFLAIIRDPIFRSWRVWHDFEYPGVKNLSPSEAKRRLEMAANGRPAPAQ